LCSRSSRKHDRPDAKVEYIESTLQNAHVGIYAGDRNACDLALAKIGNQLRRQA